MKRTSLVLTLALALLVPAAVALAAGSLPKPPNPTIVAPTSLAGVKVGQPEDKAKAAWGTGRGRCEGSASSGYCEYGESGGSKGYARIEFRNGKVSGSRIVAGIDAKKGQTTTAAAALLTMKTSSGIGIGSTYAKLKAAYPKAELIGKPSDEVFYYVLEGPGERIMAFTLLGKGKRVFEISISDNREA